MDLNHFHVQVTDMPLARKFYEGHFEFREDLVCHEDEVFLRNKEDFVLGLERVDKMDPLPTWMHIGFGCRTEEEIRAKFQEVQDSGAKIVRELTDYGDSMAFYCLDPSGNKIEVYYNRDAEGDRQNGNPA